MKYFRIPIFLLSLSLAGLLSACPQPDREIKRVQFLMGTQVEIIARGADDKQLEQAASKGFGEIERLDFKLSKYRPDSMLSRINRQAGISPVKVDDEMMMLLEKSLQVCRESQGAFDPTILPMLSVWKIGDANPSPPGDAEVKEKLKLVGCGKIVLDQDHQTVFLPEPGMGIDLGGIAKGYAADRAAGVLKENGVKSGLVNAGGDLTVFGVTGKGIAIGIQHPRYREKIIGKVYLKRGAIATSGDYERFYIFNGVRYSHIIDPRTGYPVQREASVSVKADTGLIADAWATALFVLGREAGLKLLQSRPDLEALFLEPSGDFGATEWFYENMTWGQAAPRED